MIFFHKIQDWPDLLFSSETCKRRVMRQVCYVCNTVYGQKDPLSDKRETHGLCPVHYETELKRIKKTIKEIKSRPGYLKSTRKDWWDRNDRLYLSITAVNHFKRELDQPPYRDSLWRPCGAGIFWSFMGKRLRKKTIDEVSFKGGWKPATPCPIGQTDFIPDSPFTGEGFPPSLLDKGGKGGIWISLT